jgi:hypothetical protein
VYNHAVNTFAVSAALPLRNFVGGNAGLHGGFRPGRDFPRMDECHIDPLIDGSEGTERVRQQDPQVQAGRGCIAAYKLSAQQLWAHLLGPSLCTHVSASMVQTPNDSIVHTITTATFRTQHGVIGESITLSKTKQTIFFLYI